MPVIAREVLWCNTAECDGPAIEDPEDPGNCDECAQPLERVEVVRADAYRGAVEARDEAANLLHEWLHGPLDIPHRLDLRDKTQALLYRLGGQ